MILNSLPNEIIAEIRLLPANQEFQNLYSSDPVMDEIQNRKVNKSQDLIQFILSEFGTLTIGTITFPALTPLKLSYLYFLESPFLLPGKDPCLSDFDNFFYILFNNSFQNPLTIPEQAIGFAATLNLEPEFYSSVIQKLLYFSFRPLRLLPTKKEKNTKPEYGLEFLTGVISIVHSQTGLKPQEIKDLPLTQVFWFYLQFARSQGEKIKSQTDEVILKELDSRTVEIILEFLIAKGKMPPEKKNEFFYLMTGTEPEQEQ